PPGVNARAAALMRSGAQRPLDVHTFRVDVQRKDGTVVTIEVDASPLWEDGRVTGRVGVAYVVGDDRDATSADVERAVREERERIAHALRDRIADVVLGMTTEGVPSSPR